MAQCRGLNPSCPCQDGDECHYEGKDAWRAPFDWILACPFNANHTMSSDAESQCYYCYACAKHYNEHELVWKKDEQGL